ncbi:unnamed protein product [Paramecium primaurelia]|uniref:Uncharacterized protein n=2 Tax=Paramecium TaxID=5884 RepID=A0A8S1WZ59_9CILI|nr:unnamed protein product [Paramecium primaurelia]CAD8193790.1 unnamed protein product [Paramecium pentaurelia]
MKSLGYSQLQLSQKIIKTEGDDSEMLLPESDKDELGQILNTEESRGKPMKELRFSLKNQVWIFDRNQKRHQSYKSPSPVGTKSSPSILKNKNAITKQLNDDIIIQTNQQQ